MVGFQSLQLGCEVKSECYSKMAKHQPYWRKAPWTHYGSVPRQSLTVQHQWDVSLNNRNMEEWLITLVIMWPNMFENKSVRCHIAFVQRQKKVNTRLMLVLIAFTPLEGITSGIFTNKLSWWHLRPEIKSLKYKMSYLIMDHFLCRQTKRLASICNDYFS